MKNTTTKDSLPHCSFLDSVGNICQESIHADGLCYWHYDKETKHDSDLKTKLEQRARTGVPMRYFKLSNASLANLDLVNRGGSEGFQLVHTDLYRCNLRNAHLFNIDLSFSSLMKADLRGANLHLANLEHANLLGVNLEDAKLEGVQWGEIVRQEWQADHEAEPKKANATLF